MWELANQKKDVMKFSTLFTAQNVRDYLLTDVDINQAIRWCKHMGITHVFIEAYRSSYTVKQSILEHARDCFKAAGFDVSGCVTTTEIGKSSQGWKGIACYTNLDTQKQLQKIFEYTASIFDEIMIDDFLMTDCECEECRSAKRDRSWSKYRTDLMAEVSRKCILAPARSINPNVKVIIKYPQWYDNFHNRGYDVVQETQDYDKIWVGTETRDPDNEHWGKKAQYEAYFIMRWLGQIGGKKCGGGWFDPYGTSPSTYVEQARQTVLGGAKEAVLFCYGSLIRDNGPANVRQLRAEIPGLFKLASIIREKPIKGILAPKPPNSDCGSEPYVFDFIGMLGLPLVPEPEITTETKAAFFSIHALKDPGFIPKLQKLITARKPILITDGLGNKLKGEKVDFKADNLEILEVKGEPRSLLKISSENLYKIRKKMLKPFGIEFNAPSKVALYLIGDEHVIIENFNDEKRDVELRISGVRSMKKEMTLPENSKMDLTLEGEKLRGYVNPRTMIVYKLFKSKKKLKIGPKGGERLRK